MKESWQEKLGGGSSFSGRKRLILGGQFLVAFHWIVFFLLTLQRRCKVVHLLRLMAGDDVAHQYFVVYKLLATEFAALRCSSSLHSPSMTPSVSQQIFSLLEAPTTILGDWRSQRLKTDYKKTYLAKVKLSLVSIQCCRVCAFKGTALAGQAENGKRV